MLRFLRIFNDYSTLEKILFREPVLTAHKKMTQQKNYRHMEEICTYHVYRIIRISVRFCIGSFFYVPLVLVLDTGFFLGQWCVLVSVLWAICCNTEGLDCKIALNQLSYQRVASSLYWSLKDEFFLLYVKCTSCKI